MAQNHVEQRNYIRRSRVDYLDLCEPFRVKEKNFTAQYYPYYHARLVTMRPLVEESARQNWGNQARIVSLSNLADLENQRVVVIGILFKSMVLQPTILKEISEDYQLMPQPIRDTYIDDQDYLILQDERERVKLFGNLHVHSHVTGIVVGLLGFTGSEGNEFIVEDYCYPFVADSIPRPIIEEDKYVLILSGLGFSLKPSSQLTSAQSILVDFVLGLLGPTETEKAAKIVKLIIAGNCISEKVRKEEEENDKASRKPWMKKGQPFTVEIMKIVDDFLANLSKSIEIDLMPGYTDANSMLLPQQPIHPCILPKSSISTGVRGVTNPYAASFDSLIFMGTSGQNVHNLRQYSDLNDAIEILEKTITWRHLAPTAPDTLHSYPCPENDPFIMKQTPHVYFAGNQDKFSTKFKKIGPDQHVRLISVPSFEKTFSGAIVNLRNLACDMISFA